MWPLPVDQDQAATLGGNVSNFEHQQIRLRGGRTLAYLGFGDPQGVPIL